MYGKFREPMTQELYDRIELAYAIDFFSNWKDHDVAKVWTDKLTADVINVFENKKNSPDFTLTYNAYSGHDSTIAGFLTNLEWNSFDCLLKELETGVRVSTCNHTIEYASNIIWELNKVQDPNDDEQTDYLVRMLYNGQLLYSCQDAFQKGLLKAEPKYEGYCTLDEFKEVSKTVFQLGDRYDAICTGERRRKIEAVNLSL